MNGEGRQCLLFTGGEGQTGHGRDRSVFTDLLYIDTHFAVGGNGLGEWVEDGMDEQTFVAAAAQDVSEVDPYLADAYQRAGPSWHSFRGFERYWRKKREAAA